jgi:tetratricopeptide (TPR) repeat protein
MFRTILPAHLSLYDWLTSQSPSLFTITVKLPPDVDASSVVVDLRSGDPTVVIASVNSELPFLAGSTTSPLSKLERAVDGRNLILTFTKATPGTWPSFIASPVPDSDLVIDPCSALQSHLLGVPGAFLASAVSANYPPAIVCHARELIRSGDPHRLKEAASLLRIASEYGHGPADYLLGMLAVRRSDYADAIAHFKKGAERGDLSAQNCLGEIYSPFEGGVSGFENPEKAVEIFTDILTKGPDHAFALYNLAHFYRNGAGVPKNVRRAQEMYAAAKKGDPMIPEMEFPEQRGGWGQAAAAMAVITGVGALGWWVIRYRRR